MTYAKYTTSHQLNKTKLNTYHSLCITLLCITRSYSYIIRRGPVRYKFQSLFELENIAVVNVKNSEGMIHPRIWGEVFHLGS